MNLSDCVFCKIANGQIQTKKLGENEHALAFQDLAPQAPVHVLIIPKKHLSSLSGSTSEDTLLLGECLQLARKCANDLGLTESGYRIVTNMGEDGGQSVFHLHFHLLGGRKLTWPPG